MPFEKERRKFLVRRIQASYNGVDILSLQVQTAIYLLSCICLSFHARRPPKPRFGYIPYFISRGVVPFSSGSQ